MSVAEGRLNRRQALLGVGVVSAGALAALMPAGVLAADDESRGLEGAWLVTITPDHGTAAPHQVLTLYTKGGGVAAISDNAPNTGSTGFGAWERTGEDQYLNTFELFAFNASGQLAGILRIRAHSTIKPQTRDHMIGQAHIDFQPNGSPTFFPAGSTHFTGSRIRALPL